MISLKKILTKLTLSSPPAGTIVAFYGATAPKGWLLCDGSPFSSSTYSALYQVLGSTTLPNLKGKMLVGYNFEDEDFNSIGNFGGSKGAWRHTHTNTHTHKSAGTMPYFLMSNGNIAVNGTKRQFPSTGGSYHFVYSAAECSIEEYNSTANTTITTSASGSTNNDGTAAIDPVSPDIGNMPPYLVINYIISTGGIA